MMTAYLAFKALENGTLEASQMLTVSNAAWKVEGSRMFLDPKVPVSVSSLIKGYNHPIGQRCRHYPCRSHRQRLHRRIRQTNE